MDLGLVFDFLVAAVPVLGLAGDIETFGDNSFGGFVGGGFGHGVGMSQTGSYRLGENGWPYQRILQFYYPNTQLLPISNDIVFWQDPGASTEAPEAGGNVEENSGEDNEPAFSLP